MKNLISIAAAILIASSLSYAQNQKQIRGVWRVAEIVVTGNNAGTVSNPQPGLVMFGKKHFNMMYVPSDRERPIYAGGAPTADEKVAAFDSLIANAGTYEFNGKTLIIHPTVARNPGFAGGGFATYQVRAERNTIWLSIKTAEFNFRVGDKVVSLGGPASETRIKLTRLE